MKSNDAGGGMKKPSAIPPAHAQESRQGAKQRHRGAGTTK